MIHSIYAQNFCREFGITANLDRARRALDDGWAAGEMLTTADVLLMRAIGGLDKTFEVDSGR